MWRACIIIHFFIVSIKHLRKKNPFETSHPLEELANAAGLVPGFRHLTINLKYLNALANNYIVNLFIVEPTPTILLKHTL